MTTPWGARLPIVLGPMAGGPSTPALAAAVSNAGGTGFLGEGYASPDQIRRDIHAVKAQTSAPFGVNLFVPGPYEVDRTAIERAIEELAPYRAALGLGEQAVPAAFAEDFEAQLEAVRTERVPVLSVTFGTLAPDVVETFTRAGTVVGGTATTPAEAVACRDGGVAFVVAQGSEAGGHRGSFLDAAGDDLIGLTALVPQVIEASGLPVVAAGGIMDGRGIRSALDLGACAAQLGTAFLLCPEAGTSAPYREAVRGARAEDTVITRAFSGRRARGIVNRLARDLAGRTDLPPYPVMNALTRDLRRVAAEHGDASVLSLWAGQGVGLAREMAAPDLVEVLAGEARLTGGGG